MKGIRLIVIVLMCMHYTFSLGKNIKDLLSESLVSVSVERHWVGIDDYRVSFLLPQGFSKTKSLYIVSDAFAGDRYVYMDAFCVLEKKNINESYEYMDTFCVLEKKDINESYFAVAKYDYGEHYVDSLFNERVKGENDIMPLLGPIHNWYHCGYINGDPYIMTLSINRFVPFSTPCYDKEDFHICCYDKTDFMRAFFVFDVYTKSGILFHFCYDMLCSRYNFQYEKIMDTFKSIRIEKME